jgi:hypothetical protein
VHAGDFNFCEALSHLAHLKVLEGSDTKVKDEVLAAGLARPPQLTRLVMQETMQVWIGVTRCFCDTTAQIGTNPSVFFV